jgi:hypothetical protein
MCQVFHIFPNSQFYKVGATISFVKKGCSKSLPTLGGAGIQALWLLSPLDCTVLSTIRPRRMMVMVVTDSESKALQVLHRKLPIAAEAVMTIGPRRVCSHCPPKVLLTFCGLCWAWMPLIPGCPCDEMIQISQRLCSSGAEGHTFPPVDCPPRGFMTLAYLSSLSKNQKWWGWREQDRT